MTELKQGFVLTDTNGDGQLTKEELKTILSKLDKTIDGAVIDKLIEITDVNVKGKVDFNEFIKVASQ